MHSFLLGARSSTGNIEHKRHTLFHILHSVQMKSKTMDYNLNLSAKDVEEAFQFCVDSETHDHHELHPILVPQQKLNIWLISVHLYLALSISNPTVVNHRYSSNVVNIIMIRNTNKITIIVVIFSLNVGNCHSHNSHIQTDFSSSFCHHHQRQHHHNKFTQFLFELFSKYSSLFR